MRVFSQWRSVWASSLLLLAALLGCTVQASVLRGSDASVLQPQLAHRVEIVEEAPMRVEAGVVGEAPPAVLPHSLAAMASEAQHSAQSSVDVDASAFAAAVQQVVEQEWAFLATRGFQQELQMSSAPTQPSQACEIPMARTVGVATVSCEQKTTLAINEQCVLSCKPGYALVGKPYKCVSGGFGRPAHLAGKQRCEPACPPMSAAQLAEINRGASTPAGAGTCGKLTAGGARCGISCEAGATYTGSPYVCQVKTGRYLGTGRCIIRSAAEKAAARTPEAAAKARAEGIAASKARAAARQQQQQVLQPAAAPKAAAPKAAAPKRNGRKLFEFLRSLNLPAEVQQHLPEQLQSEKALMSLESQTHAGTEVLVGGPLDALLSAGSEDNKVDSFGAYLKTFVSRYDASAVKGNLAQNFRDGSSAILVRWALNGNATGEVLKKKQLLYKGVQSPDSVQALALWKEAITEARPSKLFQPSVADSEVCNKLPIDPLLPGHKVFALMVADSALCMQMHAPSRSFGIYFQFGAALQALIPPPMQGFKAAGLAVSLKRGLRVEEMKDLALGFGTGVHAITPQTCLSSGSALVSDEQTPPSQVPQYSLLGCKGHVWAQMEAEWNPLDLLPAPVKENIEKYSTGLAEAKLEGRATMLVDLEPDSLASLTKQQLLEREEQERLRTITLTAAPQPASEVTFTYPDGRKEIISSAAVTATNIAPKRDNTVANYVAQVTKGSSAGFSAYIQAQLTASLQMGVFFKGGIDVSALATVYAQGFTQQRLPAVDAWDEGDDTADGLYVQLEVSLELKAKYLEAIDFIKRKVGGSALANQTVSNPPIPDAEWDKTVKNAIRIKLAINGRGLTLIFQFNERSVSITIGFMSAELCVLWSKDDKCVGGHLISLRGLARKAGEFQQWLVRGARKFLDSHSELARLIETPMGTVVARPDQPVAWLVPADTNTAPTKLPLSFMEKYLQVSKLRAKDLAVLAAASSKMKFVDKLTKQVVDLNLGSQSWFERTFLTSKEEDEARAAMSAIIREAVASSSELHAAVLHTLCASKTEQKCIHTKREKKFMLSPAPPKPALDHVRVNICRLVTHGSGAAEEKTCELNPDYLFYLNQLSSDKKKFL